MDNNYYQTKESVEEYIRLAEGVNGSALIEKLRKYLESNALLLEIGSGPGTDFKLLRYHFNVVGSDFSNEFLTRLKRLYQQDQFLNLNATTLKTDLKFDGIYSNKVLQHLTDTELKRSVKRQFEILNNNAIVCHSFWKGKGEETFKGQLVNYQTPESIQALFEVCFEPIILEPYKEFDADDSLLLIARKKDME